MNHPGESMVGKCVVLKPEALKPEYRTPEFLVAQVGESFLARNKNAMGQTIFVYFHDGDSMATGLLYLERMASEEETAAFHQRVAARAHKDNR